MTLSPMSDHKRCRAGKYMGGTYFGFFADWGGTWNYEVCKPTPHRRVYIEPVKPPQTKMLHRALRHLQGPTISGGLR